MTDAGYIEPGSYRDVHGTEIKVTARRPDGRYSVSYGRGASSILSARTIRELYPARGAALVAAAAGTTGAAAIDADPRALYAETI